MFLWFIQPAELPVIEFDYFSAENPSKYPYLTLVRRGNAMLMYLLRHDPSGGCIHVCLQMFPHCALTYTVNIIQFCWRLPPAGENYFISPLPQLLFHLAEVFTQTLARFLKITASPLVVEIAFSRRG